MKYFKFLLFSDFHYKKKMYPATVSDLDFLMKTAKLWGADTVIHAGDFCNNYLGSPELVDAYINNSEDLAVFGCYGNHELESRDNSMQTVTPLLSNRHNVCVFGTCDGKVGDGSIGYYYTDISGYRFIFLDTNYSLTPDGEYEHNRTASWGKPSENSANDSLGTSQLAWLERVLGDAAEQGIPCVTVSHASFSGAWSSSPDAERVRAIFRSANEKRAGTVIMAINGHYHTCNTATVEDVFYFDCPSTLNGIWKPQKFNAYTEKDENAPEYTFDFEDYDEEGKLVGVYPMSYSKLSMGAQSLFYESPAYALVTLCADKAPEVDVIVPGFAYGKTL